MEKVFKAKNIGNLHIKNSLVLPPMVCFNFGKGDGYVSDKNINHYKQISENGIGLIIVEATAIDPKGRLSMDQLGIWSDDHIEGLKKIVEVIHKGGAKAIIQLHHAGLNATKEASGDLVSSSEYEGRRGKSRALTIMEIGDIVRAFVNGGIRAKKAGFDGVEIHGAHGYLLTQFFSEKVNKRRDRYGKTFENRNRLAREIYNCVRYKVGEDFIIGIRMGSNENSLEESIKRAKYFEELGFDYLSVSTGFDNTPLDEEIEEDFPGNWIVYGGKKIKENVGIPVIGVNKIKEKEQIKRLIEEEHLDFVAIGRAQLADYNFTKHLREGEEILTCLECRPCEWFTNGDKCPRHI